MSSTPGFGGRSVVPFAELEGSRHAHEVEGVDLGEDVGFSVIAVHSGPGVGPRVHRHPYPEVFVVEAGEATFQLGSESVVVGAGHVVVAPSGEPHGFVNSGTGELRLVAIHGAARFATEWLEGVDPAWAKRPPIEGGS